MPQTKPIKKKKIPQPKQKPTMAQQAVLAKLKSLPRVLSTGFKRLLSRIKLTLIAGLSWFKNRPKAIKAWRKADRKKKKYRSFRLQRKLRPEPRYIPPGAKLLRSSLRFIWEHRKSFFYIFLIHATIYVVLIRSPFSTNIGQIQQTINSALGKNSQNTTTGVLATLGSVITASGSSQTNKIILAVSILLMSLVYIWAIRELHAKKQIQARDAYYKSMSPLIPSVSVLIIACLQLIPFTIAVFAYSIMRSGGAFASGFEDLAGFLVTLLISVLSLYWLTSTVVALYIVTLPGMYPMKALKAAKKLVQFQRFLVFKRIFVLPIVLLLGYGLTLALVIRFASSATFFVVEALQLLVLPLIHVYLYKLYRALI